MLSGLVIKGRGLASNTGVPTANIKIEMNIHPSGVWPAIITIGGISHKGLCIVMIRHVEFHILNFNEDIYNQVVKIDLLEDRLIDDIAVSIPLSELAPGLRRIRDNAVEYWELHE